MTTPPADHTARIDALEIHLAHQAEVDRDLDAW